MTGSRPRRAGAARGKPWVEPPPLLPGQHTELKRHGTRGRWYLAVLPDGSPIDCRTTHHAEAKAFQAKIDAGRPTRPPLDLGIAEVLDTPGLKPMKGWRRKLFEVWGTLKVRDLDEARLKRFSDSRRTKGGRPLASGSVRLDFAELGRFINAAGKRLDPTFGFKFAWMPDKSPPRERWLRRREAARLLWAARGRAWDRTANRWRRLGGSGTRVVRDAQTVALRRGLARFVLLGLYTCSRTTVMRECRWSKGGEHGHVDHVKGRLYRLGPQARKREAAANPKRSPTARIVPRLLMHMVGVEGTRGWLANDVRTLGSTGLVVHDGTGEPIAAFRRLWKEMVHDAGLGADVVHHTLRHTGMTWYLEQGASPSEVADLAGLDWRPMLRTYAKVETDFTDQVADAVDRAVRADRSSRAAVMAELARQEALRKEAAREAAAAARRGARTRNGATRAP